MFSISVIFAEYDFRFVDYWIDFSEGMFFSLVLQWDLDLHLSVCWEISYFQFDWWMINLQYNLAYVIVPDDCIISYQQFIF